MAPPPQLNLQNSCIAERSKKWVTYKQIYNSPLPNTTAWTYFDQLHELVSTLKKARERTAEQFVAAGEMDELTWDFWRAVNRIEKEKKEEEKARMASDGFGWKASGDGAARKWSAFRTKGKH